MRRLLHAATTLLLCLALPSCSTVGRLLHKKPKKKLDEPTENVSHIVGTVEMVNPEQRFVLIRTQEKIVLGAGQELTVLDPSGAQSKVKVSPEKKLDFLTADIVEGNPLVGSVVYFKFDKKAMPPADPNKQIVPALPPQTPVSPASLPEQPPPLVPVTSSEFLKPENKLPVPPPPRSTSPIPPQPFPSATPGATIPVPGQIELPPVVR